MREFALQLDTTDDASTGPVPWIVAVLATLGLIAAFQQVVASVPQELSEQAQRIAADAGAADIEIHASGRDLSLAGVLPAGSDRDLFVHRIASIDGVRSVSETLSVFDPEADARARRAAFGDAIGAADLSSVAFEPGSAQFAAGSERALDELATLLRTWPEYRVRVAGHTDNTGRPDVNLRLSRERAAAVADYLMSRGAASDQVIATGYGATQPIADNATEAGRSRNRRIEVRYVD